MNNETKEFREKGLQGMAQQELSEDTIVVSAEKYWRPVKFQ